MTSTTGGIQRTKDGVPQWDGEATTFQEYEELCLQWEQSTAYHKRYLCGPRLVSELSGTARKHVMGKRPDWLSYQGGVTHLLEHLRECLGRPTIPELTEYLNKFFRHGRRRRLETMNEYITRKTEVYHRARQALSRVKKVYDRSTGTSYYGDSGWRHDGSSYTGWTSYSGPTDHAGGETRPWSRGPGSSYGEADEARWTDARSEAGQPPSEADPWEAWDPWRQGQWSHDYRSNSQSDDAPWKLHTEELLPEYLQGWYLLADAGLDATEKNMIQTAIGDDFRVSRISQELRRQWPDDELKKRDQQSKASGYWQEDLPGEDEMEETSEAWMLDLNEEGQALYGEASEEAQQALALIQQGRRTLREARARQHQVRLSRQYYRVPGQGRDRDHGKSAGKGKDSWAVTCLRCGKAHRTSECPDRGAPQASKEQGNYVETAPFLCYAETEQALGLTEVGEKTTKGAVRAGYGVIDGGATKTLGSVHAVEALMECNRAKHGSDGVTLVDPENRPVFGFGNSSQDQCLSTAHMRLTADQKPGMLQIHTLDKGEGPILISIKTLRSLKAVIDFENDLMVLRALDASKAIPLERSAAGHQLLPLSEDLFERAITCKTQVPSIRDMC